MSNKKDLNSPESVQQKIATFGERYGIKSDSNSDLSATNEDCAALHFCAAQPPEVQKRPSPLSIDNPSEELVEKVKIRMKQLGLNDVSTYLTHLVLSDMPVSKSDITVKEVAVAWENNVTEAVLRAHTNSEQLYTVKDIYDLIQVRLLNKILPKYDELPDGVKRGFAQRFKRFRSTKAVFRVTYIKGTPTNQYVWSN